MSKWFAKFHAGAFLLGDASQFGRPVEVDSDQIKKLIENNQCYTMLEIDSILKIFKALNIICTRLVMFITLMFAHNLLDFISMW